MLPPSPSTTWTHRISRSASNLSLRHFLPASITRKDMPNNTTVPNKDTHAFPRLPTETWIKVVKILIDDNDLDARSALYELCLVSRCFRSFAQPALFHCLRVVDRNLSPQAYRALCRCGQGKYRHVLNHVREFKIKVSIPAPRIKKFRLSSSPPPHPISLLPFMTQLTTLSISVWMNKDHLLPSILRRSTNKLTRLFFEFAEAFPTPQEILAITAFISKQKGLKHLTLTFPHPILVPFGSLPQLESIDSDWKQIFNFLPGKTNLRNICIRASGRSDLIQWDSHTDTAIVKKALSNIRYIRLSVPELISLELWEYAKNLEFLRISVGRLPTFDLLNILVRFPNLKVVVLETPWLGDNCETDRELFAYHILYEIDSLESIIYNDLDTDVWTKKVLWEGETVCAGVPEIEDLFNQSRRSGHVYYI